MDRRFLTGMLKDWGLALLIVVGVLAVWSFFQPRPPSSGAAPDFVLTDLEGRTVSLADIEGEVIVLNFWATWCGPCVAEIPELAAFHAENPDVPLYGISVDDGMPGARLAAKSGKLGITYPVLHDEDGRTSNAYGINGIPVTFVLDGEREIRAVINGSLTKSRLQRAVDAL